MAEVTISDFGPSANSCDFRFHAARYWCGLKRLAWESAAAPFEHADATLIRELRALIDGDKANDGSHD